MSRLIVALLFPLLAVAQSTFLWRSLPGGVTPDLVGILALACGLRGGAAAGSAAGLWAGTLVAALRGELAAPMALLYGGAGWLAGAHAEKGASSSTFPWVGCALVVLITVMESALSKFLGGAPQPLAQLFLSLAWNSAFCLVLVGAGRTGKRHKVPVSGTMYPGGYLARRERESRG